MHHYYLTILPASDIEIENIIKLIEIQSNFANFWKKK